MPRGVPNTKRDDTGMRYTTFHVPLALPPKQGASTYLKYDSQFLWTRNAIRKRETQAEEPAPSQDQRRGSQVIVIHPGSRNIRIGRACDVNPVSVPAMIARKCKGPVAEPVFAEGICRPQDPASATKASNGEGHTTPEPAEDPFEKKLAAITVSLRDRMRFYKLRVTPNAATIASQFNEQFKPEVIADHNDLLQVEWLDKANQEDVIIGEKIYRLPDPYSSGYTIKSPIHGTDFNTRDYNSTQLILSDLEAVIQMTLTDSFKINPSDYKNYSVVLVIPDFYERAYVRDWVNLLLVSMGFKQLCAQQESLAATYGAGISNACVVDIGAVTTSIACVDEGLVIPDSRMLLNIGGNDVTEFLLVLLQRINFPYRDINLVRSYDWQVMEDLKIRLCTLAEGDVALNLYDFTVRRPGRAEKYGLRAYDEIILAPMCLFEPRVIEFDKKRAAFFRPSSSQVVDEILPTDRYTRAMLISTEHLMSEAPAPVDPPANGVVNDQAEKSEKRENAPASLADGSTDTPMEIVDVEDESKPRLATPPASAETPNASSQPQDVHPPSANPAVPPIDVYFEASKLPLDVAIFNSARAAGGDEKIRKYLQAVLIIGGSSLIPGMNHALESRLQAIATPLVPNMEKVQIIPPPKDVDPRVLAWKGAAVLGKMDGVSDLWITAADWDILGIRGLKERCFYL
ncbi:actin-like protein arp8 [Pleurotus pulmonarius]|nr:actin-like protein arp8 [Pleurotus pulmonarius]KAF4593865.1 actin-like protein arp8 [Pleurotus pulmonarius]